MECATDLLLDFVLRNERWRSAKSYRRNGVHYVCTVNGNQPKVHEAITRYFEGLFKRNPQTPADFVSHTGDDDPCVGASGMVDAKCTKSGRAIV